MRLLYSLLFGCGLLSAERFDVNTLGRIVRPSDPQLSPDDKLIAAIGHQGDVYSRYVGWLKQYLDSPASDR